MTPLRPFVLALALVAAGCADDAPGPGPSATPAGDADVQSNETPDADGPALEATADTTGPAEVTVAGQTVPARAVVTAMEAGDRACMVTLRTDAGAAQTVFADYSVCDSDAIEGRRVQIEYAPDEIMAASCDGDPECLDSETVALAVVATPIDG